MAKTILLCIVHSLTTLPKLCALPCETQMLQIVTLCSDYLHQISHLCIIDSLEDATWFNNLLSSPTSSV